MVHINQSRASWVTEDGEIDPAFREHGAKQERRINTELIKPHSIVVPHLPWLDGDDDMVAKMKQRRVIASEGEG